MSLGYCLPQLGDCLELRELVLTSSWPKSDDVSLINTITSTNIRKIIFDQWSVSPRSGAPLDNALSDLVDRLRASGYEHTLELEFQPIKYAYIGFDVNLDKFFPRFIEKGRVTVVETTGGKLLHCSDK